MEAPRRRHCPSFLEIALVEAGALDDIPHALIRSHAGRCPRCGGTLCEIRVARRELLGATPSGGWMAARRAAGLIAKNAAAGAMDAPARRSARPDA
jgi:hypothetical protein